MDEHDFPPCPKCNCATDRDGCMDSWCGWKRPAMPDVLTDDELLELEALERAATPGPWTFAAGSLTDWKAGSMTIEWIANGHSEHRNVRCDEDGALMAALRNAAPRLLAEVRRLRAELARLQQAKPRITAAMVKEVRERTGAGLLGAKALLEATGGDVEKAVELARRGGGDAD